MRRLQEVEDIDKQGKVVEPYDEQLRQLEEGVDGDNFPENVYVYMYPYQIPFLYHLLFSDNIYFVLFINN